MLSSRGGRLHERALGPVHQARRSDDNVLSFLVASWSLANAQANERVNFFIFPDWLMDQCRKIIG